MSSLQDWLPSYLVPFFTLSGPVPTPANPDSFPNFRYYNVDKLDACIVITCILTMAILRDATRLGIMEPFARWKLTRDLARRKKVDAARVNGNGKANGVVNGNGDAKSSLITNKEARHMRRSVLRFAEQSWALIYYTCSWSAGLYLHRNFPTKLLDPVNVFQFYPHIPIPTPVKIYYLTQLAFYIHQILILQAEAHRADHLQMMTHHFITVALVTFSYMYHFTRVGCLVMFLMDWCDIILPLAKMLRYLAHSTLCDLAFVVFLVSWFVTRHVLFVLVIMSLYTDAPKYIPRIWDPANGYYMTFNCWVGFVASLCALQVIQLMWMYRICLVAWRVVSGKGAEDNRSDDEGGLDDKKED